ncbi:MAG: polysaccharide deacetylase family protein [Myxococcota bacterium]
MKALVRTIGGRVVRSTGWLRSGLRRTGVVVAFHRVNDRTADDALTKSPADYRRFCSFFKAHFDVVSLSDFATRLETGRSVEGCLVITHDDGYLDNRLEAAPILADLGLPATFFLTTEFIGSEAVPHWDEEAGAAHPWMSWDQVREMRDMGFEIGCHTATHADLGRIDPQRTAHELRESRARLEHELGSRTDLFAYPYGGLANMTQANRAVVRELGFRTCLSCCGGLIRDGADPYDLARVPISPWYRNPDQLAFELGRGRA